MNLRDCVEPTKISTMTRSSTRSSIRYPVQAYTWINHGKPDLTCRLNTGSMQFVLQTRLVSTLQQPRPNSECTLISAVMTAWLTSCALNRSTRTVAIMLREVSGFPVRSPGHRSQSEEKDDKRTKAGTTKDTKAHERTRWLSFPS